MEQALLPALVTGRNLRIAPPNAAETRKPTLVTIVSASAKSTPPNHDAQRHKTAVLFHATFELSVAKLCERN